MNEHQTATKLVVGVLITLIATYWLVIAAQKVWGALLVIQNAVLAIYRSRLIAVRTATVTWTVAQWLLNAALTANPIGLVVAAIALLVAALVLAYQKSETFRRGVNFLKDHWELLLFAFGLLPGIIALIIKHWDWLKNKGKAVFEKLKDWLQPLLDVFNKIKDTVQWLIDNIGKIGGALGRVIPGGGGGGNERSSTGLTPKVQSALQFASQQGWGGSVTSGFRTYAEQSALYQRYLRGEGPVAARPGTSSHEFGQAVDVTQSGTFGAIMNRAPSFAKLYSRVSGEPWHFSVTGYARGGIVPGPIGMPQLAMVHGGETITPPGEGTINLYVDGHKLFSWFRDAEKKDRRRNGR